MEEADDEEGQVLGSEELFIIDDLPTAEFVTGVLVSLCHALRPSIDGPASYEAILEAVTTGLSAEDAMLLGRAIRATSGQDYKGARH